MMPDPAHYAAWAAVVGMGIGGGVAAALTPPSAVDLLTVVAGILAGGAIGLAVFALIYGVGCGLARVAGGTA